MKKSLVMTLMIMVMALIACDDDDPVKNTPPAADFENLTERAHVLNNIEVAYNQRRIDKYSELLDANFTFYLSTGDVGGGLPADWDRAVDMNANTNLFSSDPDPLPKCTRIEMDVQWENGLTWVEIPAMGGETWYTTTVFYDFEFDVEPNSTWINNPGAKVQFTTRNAGTDEAPLWKLVEMRDLGDPDLIAPTSGATSQTTWGQVKAMYRD
jgi:hypothetical protein